MTASRVVAVNRDKAVAEAEDLSEALAMLLAVEAEGGLESFQPFWAARAELHARDGLTESAASAYDRAIVLERDPAVRDFLLARKDGLTDRK